MSGAVAVAGGGTHSLGIRSGSSTAVAFSSIADSREGAIVLNWETEADEALSGFRLYRTLRPGDFSCITDSPLSPHARTCEDRAIEPGKEYCYLVAALPGSERVRIDIYDLAGRLVRRLVDRPMEAGRHQIEWNGGDARGRTVAQSFN